MGNAARRSLAGLALLMLAAGCGDKPAPAPPAPPPPPPILKISVLSDGRLFTDGRPVTLESLRGELKNIKEKKGVVWYYREAGHMLADEDALKVMEAITAEGLPIRMSSRSDFSDSIGMDGKPVPGGR